MVEADGAHWSAALRDEDVSLGRAFTAELAQGADFIAPDRMDGWRAVLGPADVHAALVKLDLMPLEVAELRGPQSVTVGDQDHGRVPMSVAAVLAGIVHELFDLAGGQVFPNCTVYSVWWGDIPSLITHRKFRLVEAN